MRSTSVLVAALLPALGLAAPAVAQSATPTVTATPTSDCAYPTPLVAFPGGGIDTGAEARILVGFDTPQSDPDAVYDYGLVREVPEPIAQVRSAAATATGTVFTVLLGETHRFTVFARERGTSCPFGGGDVRITVPVRPALSISAKRNAPRDYTFSGRVLPGRGQRVTLWRVEADGRRVLTASGTVARDGTYRFDRRFTGSGRFGFQVDVAGTTSNLPGRSPVRPTVLH